MTGIMTMFVGRSPAGGGFTPADLASTRAWFDASDASTVTYNGSNQVSAWTDKISSTSFTRTASSAITYNASGYLVLSNPGVGLEASTRFSLPANPDIFIATVLLTSDTAAGRIFTIGDNGAQEIGTLGAQVDITWRYNNGNWVAVEDITPSTVELLVWQRAAGANYGTASIYLDGTALTFSSSNNSTLFPTSTTALSSIGTGYGDATNSDFDGNIYEIVICESSSSTERQQIEGYLAHKHGIAANLPAGHPYKSSPP